MCAVHIDMRNSIEREREQQLYVVSRPMGHASHKCHVYAKDKRLGQAIFGLMEATMNSTSSRSAKKVGLETLASDLPCLTCSHYSFSNSALKYGHLDAHISSLPSSLGTVQAAMSLETSSSINPARKSASASRENSGRRTHPTEFYTDTHMGC
jgi:hypothetical protein